MLHCYDKFKLTKSKSHIRHLPPFYLPHSIGVMQVVPQCNCSLHPFMKTSELKKRGAADFFRPISKAWMEWEVCLRLDLVSVSAE